MKALYAAIFALSVHPVVASAQTLETSMVDCYLSYPSYITIYDLDEVADLDLCEESVATSTLPVPGNPTQLGADLDMWADDTAEDFNPGLFAIQPAPEQPTGSFADRWIDDEIFFRADDEDAIYRLDDEIVSQWRRFDDE